MIEKNRRSSSGDFFCAGFGFEEALRALYAQNHDVFERMISTWPLDISAYLRKLSANVFMTQNKIG